MNGILYLLDMGGLCIVIPITGLFIASMILPLLGTILPSKQVAVCGSVAAGMVLSAGMWSVDVGEFEIALLCYLITMSLIISAFLFRGDFSAYYSNNKVQ